MMTPLDKGYVKAMQTQNGAAFYDMFLSSMIFIRVPDVPIVEEVRRVGDNESITPIIIVQDGLKRLMLFDTQEKLAAWAKQRWAL